MVNDDVVKCPLCGGFTHIEKTELRADVHSWNPCVPMWKRSPKE